jgi:hypothetical protein
MRRPFGKAAFALRADGSLALVGSPIPRYPMCSAYRLDPEFRVVRIDGPKARLFCWLQTRLADHSAFLTFVTTRIERNPKLVKALYGLGTPDEQATPLPGPKPGGTPAAPPAAPAAPAPAASSTGEGEKVEPVKVEGFRSATFGMTETQLRAAIRKDFNLAGDKVTVDENPTERTTVLSVTVNDLLPDVGPGRVSYILGFKSKRLFQVNILWGAPVAPEATPEKVIAAANALRDYFLGAGYQGDTIMTNARANDGSVIAFKGSDAQKRTTVLRVLGAAPAKEGEKPAVALALSYIQDPQNPDVFRIAKGQF